MEIEEKVRYSIVAVIWVLLFILPSLYALLIYGITITAVAIGVGLFFLTNAIFWVVWEFIREKSPQEKTKEILKKEIKEEEEKLAIAHLKLQKKRLKDEIKRVETEAKET